MIYPAINVLANKLREIPGLNVIVGSLRQHHVTIPTPAAIIVPLEFKTARHGTQYVEVSETYEVAIAVSARQSNPYQNLLQLVTQVAKVLDLWLPEPWNDAITVKNVNISSVKFDTHPEADDLGLVVASIEVTIGYYAV